MKDSLGSVHIELHVPEFGPVKAFYGALGFAVAWESTEPNHGGYLVMHQESVVICFWPGNLSVTTQAYFQQFPADTPRGYGVEVVCMVPHLDDSYAKAQALGAVVADLTLKPWGRRDFRIVDPYGYYLRFTDRYDVLNPAYSLT